ncbi:hypothetical protein [Haloarchaeobius sp. HRN-SO-5]|uniref:hypothetical protein n=1 Tax=Haloarchaeobius sp. HRN-SO-5 TaxID=3446118 RepID=UPI003EB9FB5F
MDFDERIRVRHHEWERVLATLVTERINHEQKPRSLQNDLAVQPLDRAGQIFDSVNERNPGQNPSFDELKEQVEDTRENNHRLPIFGETPRSAQILEYENLVSEANEIEGGMERLRTIDCKRRHELQDSIRKQSNSYRSTRISKTAEKHVVEVVEEIEDEADTERS